MWSDELCVSSLAPIRKRPKGFSSPLVETLEWYQIQVLFQNNTHMLLESSLNLLLNLRQLVQEEYVSQVESAKQLLSGQLLPEPKPSEVNVEISILSKFWFRP